MATIKQKKAFKNMVEYGGNISKAMIKAGYSEATAKTPQKLTESVGFIALMEGAGMTDDFLNNALYSDIKNKPKNRKPELELAYKLKGKLREKIEYSGQVEQVHSVDIENVKEIKKLTEEYEEKLKEIYRKG